MFAYREKVVARGRDSGGQEVLLYEDAMTHIIKNRRYLDGHELAIMTAVETAPDIRPGNQPGRVEYRAEGIGPRGKKLLVVVDFADTPGVVVTAYPVND